MAEMSKNDQMFLQLVMTFQSAALIQLGKVENPQTKKMEKNLSQAQYSIDMLDMLKEKTRGNLDEQLAKSLESVLTNLKLAFVEEKEKEEKAKSTT